MPGIKRKEAPVSKGGSKTAVKRTKHESQKPKTGRTAPRKLDAEAETDSDPIVESDTTEHSGDDDGVSWPSDNEETETKRVGGKGAKAPSRETQSSNPERAQDATKSPTASKEAHVKQKALAQERKAAKPNADSIARSKKLWERLRRQSHVPLDERKKLVSELFEIITGRVKEFVLKHDAGRVVQTALKYGNLEQRKTIARELKGEFRTLAESRYAKFLIGKLLVHGDDEIRDLVIPEFFGHVRRMIKHPEASWILDDVYRGAATPRQKVVLLREWYGAEFAIFQSGSAEETAELKVLLEDKPEKRASIMRYLWELINQLVQKKTAGFTMLHDAMLQYYLNVPTGSEEATEFVELLKGDEEGDLMKNLAFTKSGARVVCLALARSSAKDRKLLLKTFKNTIQTMAFDANGHQVLLAACEVIDDTVLTAKAIFGELLPKEPGSASENQIEDLKALATNLNGRVAVLHPLVHKPKAILSDEDMELLKEVNAIRASTSKKDAEVRKKELARVVSPHLLSLITSRAGELIESSFGCQFVTEVVLGAEGDKKAALQAISELAGREDMQATLATPAAGKMLKALVLGGRFDFKTKAIRVLEPPLQFADMLYGRIEEDVARWATGPQSFVVASLMEAQDFGKRAQLRSTLLKHRKLLHKIACEDPEGGGDVKAKKERAGVKGAQVLLKMLDG